MAENVVTQGGSTLYNHCGAGVVTLEQIAEIPAGEALGPRHKPVPHIDLVNGVKEAFTGRGYDVAAEVYSVTKNGARLFGVLDLAPREGLALFDPSEAGMAVGIRHSNDRAFALGVIAGQRLFVCDNLAFAGGSNILRKKHTVNLDLTGEIDRGMNSAFQSYRALAALGDKLKDTKLSDDDAKLLMYEISLQAGVISPSNLGQMHNWYFDPEVVATDVDKERGFADVADRSAWSVYNTVSRVTRNFAPHRQQDTSMALGSYLDQKYGYGIFAAYEPSLDLEGDN